MRLMIKLFVAAASCGLAAAAVAGVAPADIVPGALRPSNIIILFAGFAMVGLAAGRGNATSAIGKVGFHAGGNSLARWFAPRPSARSQSLARMGRREEFESAKGFGIAA